LGVGVGLVWVELVRFGLVWVELVWFGLVWVELVWFGLTVVGLGCGYRGAGLGLRDVSSFKLAQCMRSAQTLHPPPHTLHSHPHQHNTNKRGTNPTAHKRDTNQAPTTAPLQPRCPWLQRCRPAACRAALWWPSGSWVWVDGMGWFGMDGKDWVWCQTLRVWC